MLVAQAGAGNTGEEGVEIGAGGSGEQASVDKVVGGILEGLTRELWEVEGRGAAVSGGDGVTGLRV